MRRPLRVLCLAALALSAVSATPARASHTQESVFQDDRSLIMEGDAVRQHTLDQIKALGATTVRVNVSWRSIAPQSDSFTRPAGFDATNPAAYPRGVWSPYGALVREARTRGLRLLFTPGVAPNWAGRCGDAVTRRYCDPDPTEYGAFIQAIAKRFPTVHRWSFWNEPNQVWFLLPQQLELHGQVVAESAVLYRALLRAAIAGLHRSGHRHDQVLLGETAPLGLRHAALGFRSTPPMTFYQTLFCLDSLGRPLRGQAARDTGCTGRYTPLAVTGVAVHPYTRAAAFPPTWIPGVHEITLSKINRIGTVLDQGALAHRIPAGLPVYFTEYGFQSNPPEPVLAVPLADQAVYIDESDWIAYRIARIKSVAQYLLYDDVNLLGFQTGLRFSNGVAKPSLAAYRLPIWVRPSGRGVEVWGQVRPADGTPQRARILNGSVTFARVMTVRTNKAGYFDVRLPRQPGANWRISWRSPGGKTFVSRTATVDHSTFAWPTKA